MPPFSLIRRAWYNGTMFEGSISRVSRSFERIGLGYVFDGVRRISVVRQESYHDIRTRCIGLNPRDVTRPYAAFHRRPYLLIHELGHAFAEVWLTRAERRRLAPLFGSYDAPYRRLPKPRQADRDHVSRYSMTHPAEDFAETFAVCLWQDWDRAGVARLMGGKSARLRAKVKAMSGLISAKKACPPSPPGSRAVLSGLSVPASGQTGSTGRRSPHHRGPRTIHR